LQTRSSGEYRFSAGQLQPSKKLPALRGLNNNHNHDLRLTLARKMAAIVLTLWKKGERFDPGELKRQAA
jgi:hypothetical protein